jgi:hypothetical protein
MKERDERGSETRWWEERPVSRHRVDFGGALGATWVFFLFAVCCLGLVYAGFFLPAREGPVVGMVMGSLAALGAGGFIAAGAWRWAALVKQVDVYDGGLVWQHGGEQRAGWDDIEEFYRAEVTVNNLVKRREVVIKTHDRRGATFTFALGGWKTLADRTQYEITMRKVPVALAEYRSGEKVRFGKGVAVSTEGVAIGGQTLAWNQVRGLRVCNGHILASAGSGREPAVCIADTPNFPVLLKLLELSPAGLAVG